MRRDTLDVRNLTVLEIANNTVVTAHDLGNIGNTHSISGVGDFDLDGDADVALHFDTGSVRNYVTLETENHVVVTAHTIGAIGGDFVVA
jgi:hypothetical protein